MLFFLTDFSIIQDEKSQRKPKSIQNVISGIDKIEKGHIEAEREHNILSQDAAAKELVTESGDDLCSPTPEETTHTAAMKQRLSPEKMEPIQEEHDSVIETNEVEAKNRISEETNTASNLNRSLELDAATSISPAKESISYIQETEAFNDPPVDKAELSVLMIPETEYLDASLNTQVTVVPNPDVRKKQTEKPDTSSWRFTVSNLNSKDKTAVAMFMSQYGCKALSAAIDDDTTHVIVKTDKSNMAQRTLKYLQGVCRGLPVISHLWIQNSLEEDELKDPLLYEVKDMELEGATGPTKSREAKVASLPPLLKGWEVMVMGTIQTIPENSVKELIKLCGARFVDQLKKFSFSQDFKGIVVVDSITELEARQVRPIHFIFLL